MMARSSWEIRRLRKLPQAELIELNYRQTLHEVVVTFERFQDRPPVKLETVLGLADDRRVAMNDMDASDRRS